MGMSVGDSGGMSAEPNVVPMIDILLVLLIIFMVSQPMSRISAEHVRARDDNALGRHG